jgi:hypothetical protein
VNVNPVSLLLGMALFAWAAHACRSGWITSGNGPRIYRSQRPLAYWLLVVGVAAMAVIVLIDTLLLDL